MHYFFYDLQKKVFLRTDSLAFSIRREIEVIVFLRVWLFKKPISFDIWY